nr:coiled-coil domain-containing protein 173-like isoform X1 [Crassostrea gigas]
MEKMLYFGDDDLRQAMERMDQLSHLKLKLGAAQYLEDLRKDVLADNLYNVYRTEEETEREQEQRIEKSRRIIQKLQVEILKKILPINRNSQMAVRWMKTIKENHVKMATVQMELLKKLRQHDANNFFEESNEELQEKNQFDIFPMNPNEENEEKQLERVTNDKNAQLINKIQVDLLRTILPMDRSARMAVKYMKIIRESRTKMLAIQEELLKKLSERKADCMTQSLGKLENEIQIKWRTTQDAWDKEKRNRLVFSILVEQVRRIRSRRCPQMAGKIMKKLQDRHLICEKLLEELVVCFIDVQIFMIKGEKKEFGS